MLKGSFAQARVLTGPTGAGKSRLALDVAARLGAEIVAMDSMTLYKGMDIGTAKPTATERAQVPHHLLDVLEPWESANVAWWLAQAASSCDGIVARGKVPLIVGGTPLYLKALLFGLFEGPPANDELRARLSSEAERLGVGELHRRLALVDPASAQRIHENDVRRVIRALEVHELTGKSMSDWQSQWPDEPVPAVAVDPTQAAIVWINWPREELNRRIDARVDVMFEQGLIEEVRHLQTLAQPLSREASQALGYRDVMEHLAGRRSLADTITSVKTRTHQFAKRQVTWFRHLSGCVPLSTELTGGLWQGTMGGPSGRQA